MELFYDPAAGSNLKGFLLNEDESAHAIKVLRYKPGDELNLTDGKGNLFSCTIDKIAGKRLELSTGVPVKTKTPESSIKLAVSPVKKPDRNDFMIEKAVELGVSSIIFFRSDNTVKQNIKTERAQKIAISAMKQSERLYLPEIHAPLPFRDIFEKLSGSEIFIANRDHKNSQPLWKIQKKTGTFTLLIGPEGDFSRKELDLAIENGASPVSLGSARYRTETAALAGVHILSLLPQFHTLANNNSGNW